MDAPLVIVGTGMAGFGLLRAVRHLDARRAVCLIGADDAVAYSKFELARALSRGQDAGQLVVATPEQIAYRFGATILPHCRVHRIDRERRVLVTDAGEQPYDRLVLATGADALRPAPLRGAAAKRLLTVACLAEYAYLRSELAGRRQVVVLGGGIAGCELADNLVRGGFDTTLLEPRSRLLSDSFPQLCAERIGEALRSAGVRVHCDDGIQRIEPAGDALDVVTLSGRHLQAEVAVAALGTRPRTALARDAGLDVARGVRVDARLQTSDPAIYALGECAELGGRVLNQPEEIEACAHALAAVLGGASAGVRDQPRLRRLQIECCPAAVCLPPPSATGEWQETARQRGVRALFHDRSGALRGFALVGETTGEAHRLLALVGQGVRH